MGKSETANIPTFTYTKLINSRTGKEDLPRVDFVYDQILPHALEAQLISRLEEIAPHYDVVFVTDQAETVQGGVITPLVREALAQLSETYPQTIFWVDSRMRAELFRRVIVKPNREEARAASMRALGKVDYMDLRFHMEAPFMFITHGADGALVVHRRGLFWARPDPIENPVDICGAGDSFSAGAALAFKVTWDALVAARFGNLVASITIMKPGTGTASPQELIDRFGPFALDKAL